MVVALFLFAATPSRLLRVQENMTDKRKMAEDRRKRLKNGGVIRNQTGKSAKLQKETQESAPAPVKQTFTTTSQPHLALRACASLLLEMPEDWPTAIAGAPRNE